MLKPIFKISSVFILFFISQNLQAQNYFGVRAGVNFATVSTTEDGSITNKLILGGNGVVYFDFNVGKKRSMGIQPEFAFIQKGYLRELPALINDKTYTVYRLNYFDFSLLFKYKIGNEKELMGYGILGPYIGNAFSGKRIKRHDRNQKKDLDFSRYVDTNIGLIIGGGIVIPVRSVKFTMDLRYNIGLSEISEGGFDSGRLRNRGLNFSIGYAFPLGARYYRP